MANAGSSGGTAGTGSAGSTGSSSGGVPTGTRSSGGGTGAATGTRSSGRSGGGGLSPAGNEVAANTANAMTPEAEIAHIETRLSETSQSAEGEEVKAELKKRLRYLKSAKGKKEARAAYKAANKGAAEG